MGFSFFVTRYPDSLIACHLLLHLMVQHMTIQPRQTTPWVRTILMGNPVRNAQNIHTYIYIHGVWSSISYWDVYILHTCEHGVMIYPMLHIPADGERRGSNNRYQNHAIFLDYRRKFRSQTSDNMDRWKAEQGRGREKRKIRRKKSRRERVRRKKMQMREKVGKSRNTVFFRWFGAPEGRKVGSLKRRVRSQLARWEMKNCTPLGREAHVEVKMYKTHHSRTTFGSWDVEKVHAVVVRSTFPSQNVQNTSVTDHFWKLRCSKSARHCGAKHVSKSKCTKHISLGTLLEVAMSKKCTPLWREAHFEVEMLKTLGVRTTFGGSDVASLRFTTLHYTTLQYTPLHYTTLHSTTLQLQLHNYTPLHYNYNYTTTFHYTPLH